MSDNIKVIDLLWSWVKYHEDTAGVYPRPFSLRGYMKWKNKNPCCEIVILDDE